MSDLDNLSLDELFQQAKNSAAGQKRQKELARQAAEAGPATAPSPRVAFYTDPDNWVRTRGIALIEQGTETLLGNFSEYVHRHEPTTRRLIRELTPIAIDAVEYTAGWIPHEARPEGIVQHPPRQATIHLQLEVLAVAGVSAGVLAYVQYGEVRRVELAADTTFCTPGEELLLLRAGTNVLEVMSPQSIRSLYLELAL